jgi:phage protein D
MQGAEPLTLRLGHGLLEFTASADLARQHTIVVVSGWDVSAKQRISFTADAGVLGSELAGDRSGASLLQSAFGEQVDRIVHEGPVTSAEAQGLAEAAFRAQARRFVTGAGVARGDARLRVGAQVRLEGLGRMFDGVYYVSEARHVFARRAGGGYAVEFVVERPGIGG